MGQIKVHFHAVWDLDQKKIRVTIAAKEPREWYLSLEEFGAFIEELKAEHTRVAKLAREGKIHSQTTVVEVRFLHMKIDQSGLPMFTRLVDYFEMVYDSAKGKY